MVPLPDTQYINDLLSCDNKKDLGVFKINRLDKAIQRLEKNNYIQGIAARTDYYTYINRPEEGLALVREAIGYYGYTIEYMRSMIRAAINIANWDVLKEAFEEVLTLNSSILKISELESNFLQLYIEYSSLYMDNSGVFREIIRDFNLKDTNVFEEIENKKLFLKENDCSLNVYHKVLSKTFKTIYNKYSLNPKIRFDVDKLQLIVSSSIWTTEDARKITEDIDKAILEDIDKAILEDIDLDFQIEADEISIFCTNIPLNCISTDFVYDDDEDDSQLIELLLARKDNYLDCKLRELSYV